MEMSFALVGFACVAVQYETQVEAEDEEPVHEGIAGPFP
jgi:hypothetical protein